jgi:hypothetical protein
LSKDRIREDGYAAQATPEEEEEAWFYAGVAIACVLGDYAFSTRRTSNSDDTPSIPV